MSLTTEITGLTTEVRQLVNTVAAQDDLVRDKINQLAAMVPNTRQEYWVDTSGGDDAADGRSPSTPLASLDEALARAPAGGRCVINLLSDCVLSSRAPLISSATIIRGRSATGAAVMRQLAFASDSGAGTHVAGMYHVTAGLLLMEEIDMVLPQAAAGVTQKYVISHYAGGMTVLTRSRVAAAGGANTFAFAASQGTCIVHLYATTRDSSVAAGTGKLFFGVAAGADPNSDWRITTNVTSN